MPVSIGEINSEVVVGNGGNGASQSRDQAGNPLRRARQDEALRQVIREVVREELKRYLRTEASGR